MELNETIKVLRQKKQLTQEQLASYLGITAPAVNKWEKGISCPDISLLAPLARALETDLNQLLAFNEEITEQEIAVFINYLAENPENKKVEELLQLAKKKIAEFPNSEALLLNVGIILQGIQVTNTDFRKNYLEQIEDYFQRVKKSLNSEYRERAIERLFYFYLNDGRITKAEKELQELPKRIIDVEELEATLALKKDDPIENFPNLEKALLKNVMKVHNNLNYLFQNALKANLFDLADQYVAISQQVPSLFELWEYNQYTMPFELAVVKKDRQTSIEAIRNLLAASQKPWRINQTVLYQHIEGTDINQQFNKKILTSLLQEFQADEELAYLKDDAEFLEILEEFQKLIQNEY